MPRRAALTRELTKGIHYRYTFIMSSLIPKMILIGLAASISPVAVMVLVALMLGKRPLRNALWFLVGFTLVLVAIGVVAVFVFHVGTSKGNSDISAWIDIVLGIICFALVPYSWLRKRDTSDRQDAKPLSAWELVLIGMATMATNASTIVIYLEGTHQITEAHVSAGADAMALAILTLVTLVTLLIPICIYVVAPHKAEKILGSLKVWLTRHNKQIGIAILLIFGVYLLVKGINTLV
jgi:threonine/homoserine/homoserine lactone efflux protein